MKYCTFKFKLNKINVQFKFKGTIFKGTIFKGTIFKGTIFPNCVRQL